MSRRVLLIEDNVLHRKLFTAWLESSGHHTSLVHDERLAFLEAAAQQPDIIIVDVRLPYIDGRDIIRQLKTSPLTRHIPVMALTVLSSQEDEASCIAAGADMFVNKGIRMADFIDHVATLTI